MRAFAPDVMAVGSADSTVDYEEPDYRERFFHNLTPWIGVKVLSLRPKRFEIFLMAENVQDISEARGVIPFGDLRNIWQESKKALGITGEYLIESIRALDAPLAPGSTGQ